jgi:hypothetical protein
VLSAEFPETNANIERGHLVDGQVSRQLLGGAPATDPDALAVLAWLHEEKMYGVGHTSYVQEAIALVDPDTGETLTEGTGDIAHYDGRSMVTIVDLKKREQYAAGRLKDPDDNMQLHAYGLGWALRLGAKAYRLALLLFGDGKVEAIWSTVCFTETPDRLGAKSWVPYLDRIRKVKEGHHALVASGARPLPTAGDHCAQCYARAHCPSWMFPEPLPSAADSALVPLSKPGGITKDNAGDLLLYVMAVEEQAKRAREVLQSWARANGGAIAVGDRKWAPIVMNGRKSGPTVDELEELGLGHLVKQGKPYESWRIGKR